MNALFARQTREDERGGFFGLETVLVEDDEAEVLTTLSHGPFGEGDDES